MIPLCSCVCKARCSPSSCVAKAFQNKCAMQDICILGYCDLNVPRARGKEVCQALTAGIAALNCDGLPARNCTILLMPDIPRDKNPRGLWDEEKQGFESLFGLQQHVETRFVENFTRDKKGEVRSNSRRFSSGRLVTLDDGHEHCIWLQGELALNGRPVGLQELETGAPISMLPKHHDLLLPESANANADLRLSERPKPSPNRQLRRKVSRGS